MTTGMPALNHEQQQQAVERIQDLMKQGLSSGEAIAQVAKEIRENHDGERVHMLFDDNMSDD